MLVITCYFFSVCTSALFECLIPTELLPRPASLCIPCLTVGGRLAGSRWWRVERSGDSQEWAAPCCDQRWRNIYIRGGRSERLTADNQLVGQSDSKEMMESIKIFQTTGTPSCQSENIRLLSEYRAVSWKTLHRLVTRHSHGSLESEDVASQPSCYLSSNQSWLWMDYLTFPDSRRSAAAAGSAASTMNIQKFLSDDGPHGVQSSLTEFEYLGEGISCSGNIIQQFSSSHKLVRSIFGTLELHEFLFPVIVRHQTLGWGQHEIMVLPLGPDMNYCLG